MAKLPPAQPEFDQPNQTQRDAFADAIERNDIDLVQQQLTSLPQLANADLRPVNQRDRFTNGFPLFRACQKQHCQIAKLLLDHDADPSATGSNPDDQPEIGMPLHFAVEAGNYVLANQLLDAGATPNGHPNCSQSTIEVLFYIVRSDGIDDSIVRRSYSQFLPDKQQLESKTVCELVGDSASDPLKLFARMIDLGGQPPFAAIVREGFDDLAMEMVEHSAESSGTPIDHPNSTVLNNIYGASRWYGYPKLFGRVMEFLGDDYKYQSALDTIDVAIGSHNRDGDYRDYRKIIVTQLEYLKSSGQLEQAIAETDFNPLHKIATDFTWHQNYGYRASIAEPKCYVDLAELFVEWGFGDVNFRHPATNHSALSAAVKRGHHPGIETYVQWLLENGADPGEDEPEEMNPVSLAKKLGHKDILKLLEQSRP